jgi:hypothetical protein
MIEAIAGLSFIAVQAEVDFFVSEDSIARFLKMMVPRRRLELPRCCHR